MPQVRTAEKKKGGQSIMAQQRFLIGRQVKERGPLAGIQNLSSW
jgi:hypothetical protein